MSVERSERINTGSYDGPYSGVGMEFYPLGLSPGISGIVLHESGYLESNAGWDFRNIYSPFWRLIYDWQPGHRLILPGRELSLGPDRIILQPDHTHCDFQEDHPVPTFWLHFSHDCRPAPRQSVPIELSPSDIEIGLMREASELLAGIETQFSRKRVIGLCNALLQIVLSRPEILWLSETPPGIARATEYIRAHLSEPIYSGDLARVAGMGERTFNRSFQQHRGASPTRFILQSRVRVAAALLGKTELSMEEIAVQSGFPSSAYLSRMFKKVTGITPKEIRAKTRSPLPAP